MNCCHECGKLLPYVDWAIRTELGLVCSLECRDALFAAAVKPPAGAA